MWGNETLRTPNPWSVCRVLMNFRETAGFCSWGLEQVLCLSALWRILYTASFITITHGYTTSCCFLSTPNNVHLTAVSQLNLHNSKQNSLKSTLSTRQNIKTINKSKQTLRKSQKQEKRMKCKSINLFSFYLVWWLMRRWGLTRTLKF